MVIAETWKPDTKTFEIIYSLFSDSLFSSCMFVLLYVFDAFCTHFIERTWLPCQKLLAHVWWIFSINNRHAYYGITGYSRQHKRHDVLLMPCRQLCSLYIPNSRSVQVHHGYKLCHHYITLHFAPWKYR